MNHPDPLIDVDTLAAQAPGTVLPVDCRFTLADTGWGRREYLQGHLPGAVYADLDRDLSALPAASAELGRHPLPAPATLAAALARWGWQPGMTVVAYDAGGGALVAARLWWLLRMAGVPAQVLNGGMTAWTAAGQPVSSGEVTPTPSAVELHFDTARVLDTNALRRGMSEDGLRLVDARAAARFRGEEEPIDRVGGHVPGALNRPFVDNLGPDGRFRSADELREAFRTLIGDIDPGRVVHMCGSGVTACHNLLAMEHAGLHGSQLYAASWSGWVADPSRPVATGD